MAFQAQAQQVPSKKPHLIEQIIPFVFIFFFVLSYSYSPCTKTAKKKNTRIYPALKKGDSVITNSGILGLFMA